MGVDALRAHAQTVMFAVIGVPITVTRPAPDDTPIVAEGVWAAMPTDESRPIGVDFQRAEPRKVLAIPRTETLPSIPRGTSISAPELLDGPIKNWRVDGYELPSEADLMRVRLVAAPGY